MGGICTNEKSVKVNKAIVNESDLKAIEESETPLEKKKNIPKTLNETADKNGESFLNQSELKAKPGILMEVDNRKRGPSIMKSDNEGSELSNYDNNQILSNIVLLYNSELS